MAKGRGARGAPSGDEPDRMLMPLDKEFKAPEFDILNNTKSKPFFFLVPAGTLKDNPDCLNAFSPTLDSDSSTVMSLLMTLIFESLKHTTTLGTLPAVDEYTKKILGPSAKMVQGNFNRIIVSEDTDEEDEGASPRPAAPRTAQQILSTLPIPANMASTQFRGYGAGQDPGIHPPALLPLTPASSGQQPPQPQPQQQKKLNRLKRNSEATSDAASTSAAATEAASVAAVVAAGDEPRRSGRERRTTQEAEAVALFEAAGRMAAAEEAERAQATEQGQGQGVARPKWYFESPFCLVPGVGKVPKVRVVVAPLFRTMPTDDQSISEGMSRTNIPGYIVSVVPLDDLLKLEEMIEKRIEEAGEADTNSRENGQFKNMTRRKKIHSTAGSNMKFGGLNSDSGIEASMSNKMSTSSADNPNRFLCSKKMTQELITTSYHKTLKQILSCYDTSILPDVEEFDGRGHNELSKIDLTGFRDWPMIAKCMQVMGVCEEQQQFPITLENPQLPQSEKNRQIIRYHGAHLGFNVPPHCHADTSLIIFPEIAVKLAKAGAGTAVKIEDIKILWDLNATSLRKLLSGGATSGTMIDGTNRDIWLPHEQFADNIRKEYSDRAPPEEEKKEYREFMKFLLEKVIQDNGAAAGNVDESRYIANCHAYFDKLVNGSEPGAFSHPICDGLDHVGHFIMWLVPNLTKIGVATNQTQVFINWLAMLSSPALSNHSFLKSVPPNITITGPTSMGKSLSAALAKDITVPGCIDTFTDETAAALTTPNRGADMVVQLVPEATDVINGTNLSGEAKKQQRLLQTIITEKTTGKTQYWEIPDGKGGFRRVLGHMEGVRRCPFVIAANKVKMPLDAANDPMFSRTLQMMITALTPDLDDSMILPEGIADNAGAKEVTDRSRAYHAIHTWVWTHLIDSGLIPLPDLSLYKHLNSRIKQSKWFYIPASRGPNMGGVLCAVLMTLGMMHYRLGTLSDLIIRTPPTPEDCIQAGLDPDTATPEELSPLVTEIISVLPAKYLVTMSYGMGPNLQAALFVLSLLYLRDWTVVADMTKIIGKKLKMGPELIRLCVQLRDQELSTGDNPVRCDSNPTTCSAASTSTSTATTPQIVKKESLLSKHARGELKNDVDHCYFFYGEDDEPSFLNEQIKKRIIPGGVHPSVATAVFATQEYNPLNGRQFNSVLTSHQEIYRNELLKRVVELKVIRALITNLKNMRVSELASSPFSINFPHDHPSAIGVAEAKAKAREIIDSLGALTFTKLQTATKNEMLKVGENLKLHFEFFPSLVEPAAWTTLMERTSSSVQSDLDEATTKIYAFAKSASDQLSSSISLIGVINSSAVHAGRNTTSLPTSPNDLIQTPNLKNSSTGVKGKKDPNFIAIFYSTTNGFNLVKAVLSYLKNSDHKYKTMPYDDCRFYVYIMSQTPIEYHVIPDIDDPNGKITASAWGTIYDPEIVKTCKKAWGKLLVIEDDAESNFMWQDFHGPSSDASASNSSSAVMAAAVAAAAALAANSVVDGSGEASGSNAGGSTHTVPAARGTPSVPLSSTPTTDQSRRVPAGGQQQGKSGAPPKKSTKIAYLNVHGMLMGIENVIAKFMQITASKDTTPGRKIILGIPSRKNIRFFEMTETIKGTAESIFPNPLYVPPVLRKATFKRKQVVMKDNGEYTVVYDPKAKKKEEDTSDQRYIDLSGEDEETSLYKKFLEKNPRMSLVTVDDVSPSAIRKHYSRFLNEHLAGVGMGIRYPEDFYV